MSEENAASCDIISEPTEDEISAEALARVQAAPCHQGQSLEIQKWWSEAPSFRAAIGRSLRSQRHETPEIDPESRLPAS